MSDEKFLKQRSSQPKSSSLMETWVAERDRFLRQVIPPFSFVLTRFIINVIFYLGAWGFIVFFEWTSDDLIQEIGVIGWALEGAKIISFFATLLNFLLGILSESQSQAKFLEDVDNNVGKEE